MVFQKRFYVVYRIHESNDLLHRLTKAPHIGRPNDYNENEGGRLLVKSLSKYCGPNLHYMETIIYSNDA